MTYSRPTCLALIARVDSALKHGALQPYADALSEAVGEIERLSHLLVCEERLAAEGATAITELTAERDHLQRKLEAAATIEAASQRTIASWEAASVEWGKEREALRSHRDRLAGMHEAMRLVVERAESVSEVYADVLAGMLIAQPGDLNGPLHRLSLAVDAYRAARDGEGGK